MYNSRVRITSIMGYKTSTSSTGGDDEDFTESRKHTARTPQSCGWSLCPV